MAEIKRLVENQNLRTVKLAFDNNLQGHLFDTKLIAGLARPNTPMSIERTQPSLLTVSLYSVQDEPVSKLLQATKAYNQRVVDEYLKVAGQEAASSPTLDSELIKLSRLGDHRYQVHVPKRLETLAFFNQALINAFPMVARLELEKSRATTWNAQLKEQVQSPEKGVSQALPSTSKQDLNKAPEQQSVPKRGPRM